MNRLLSPWPVLLALIILALVFTAFFAVGAPAPLVRRNAPPPATIPAVCVMHWCGTSYEACFHPGGFYSAVRGEEAWAGSWRLEGSTLHIEEQRGNSDCWLTHAVEMSACLREGTLSSGAKITLETRP